MEMSTVVDDGDARRRRVATGEIRLAW